MKPPTTKNSTIVMTTNKQLLANYLLKPPLNNKDHILAGSSLEVVLDKCSTLDFPNCHDFLAGSKRFVRSGMDIMNSIMALKDHYSFKYICVSRFLGQSKDKMFIFKILVDILESGVKRMQVEGDIENSQIIFDHMNMFEGFDQPGLSCVQQVL